VSLPEERLAEIEETEAVFPFDRPQPDDTLRRST
jgi:hypothetical protein